LDRLVTARDEAVAEATVSLSPPLEGPGEASDSRLYKQALREAVEVSRMVDVRRARRRRVSEDFGRLAGVTFKVWGFFLTENNEFPPPR
jgi:hypothetical protein